MNKLKKTLILLFTVTFMASCGSEKAKKGTDETPKNEANANTPTYDKIIDELPNPTEIPVLLERTGADFDATLVNDPNKTSSYLTTNDKAALNLGVYAADLGYLCAYTKAQEAVSYYKAAQKLVEHLSIASAFELALMERFEANLSNKDSLISLVNQSMIAAKDLLKEDERTGVASLVVSGSFVEGLYISTQLVANFPHDLPDDIRNQLLADLVRTIGDQNNSLGDLTKMLSKLENDDAAIKALNTQLTDLKMSFDKLDIEKHISENKGDLILNDKTLAEVTAKVKAIRAGIIE